MKNNDHQRAVRPDTGPERLAERTALALARIGLVLKDRSQREARRYRLGMTHWKVLAFLRARSGHAATLTAVAKGLAMTPGTASAAVRVLERRGLVTKIRSKADARFVTITLSTRGCRIATGTLSTADLLEDSTKTLTLTEREFLLRALMEILMALQRLGETWPPGDGHQAPRSPRQRAGRDRVSVSPFLRR